MTRAGRAGDGDVQDVGLNRETHTYSDEPPYESGVAALRAGWRLIQATQLIPPYPGHEYDVSFLKHEFFFERIVDARAEPQEAGSG
ncbi:MULTISPECIES: hypothetical protein [unclassified Streptomyces]|uniref:hypothetical protein n=1 Tax=unclassified Streptomyces TaxID=2593676 RepID=UPI00224F4790|nr:hypothetical protein [Streptomyces sp. NBC_00047]MCX5613054.1 hypothetical protein [Streptomyces sp. NBC_00047]